MKTTPLLLVLSAMLSFTQASADPVATAINHLGLDLYREQAVASPKQNLLLSPYSIQAALAMTYAGAAGETRAEMQRVLRYPTDDETVYAGFEKLAAALTPATADAASEEARSAPPVELNVAHRLFAERGFPVRPEYTTLLQNRFHAPLQEMDFKDHADASRDTINTWVAAKTKNKITQLLDQLAPDTRLVLLNALYFRATWDQPFTKEATEPEPFSIGKNQTAPVPTMRATRHFGYEDRRDYSLITLPYKGRTFQLVIVLPAATTTLAAIEKELTPQLFEETAQLSSQNISLHLPKFKIVPPSLRLNAALKNLGMKTAFDEPLRSANFDRMSPRLPDRYLFISEVIHKSWLDLDENGTEAAAATAVLMKVGSAMRQSAPPPEVRVDRPFFFALQHIETGVCLFVGRVVDPR